MKNKIFFFISYILLGFIYSCTINKTNNDSNNNMTVHLERLSNDLDNGVYGQFFLYPEHQNTINNVWKQKENRILLEELVRNEMFPLKSRFLASVILFSQEFTFVSRYDSKKIAEIYTKALEQNLTGFSNSWGLLYKHNDEGPIGITFIILGEASIPALLPLLKSEQLHNFYIGSETATLGNGYNFRIKDVAAYYISKIKNIPIQFYQNFEQRDAEIERLKLLIKTE